MRRINSLAVFQYGPPYVQLGLAHFSAESAATIAAASPTPLWIRVSLILFLKSHPSEYI